MDSSMIPNEIWCIILKHVFRDINYSIESMKMMFAMKTTSTAFLGFINSWIVDDIKLLEMDYSMCIPTHLLSSFKKVTVLSQLHLPQLNDSTVCRMPWLKDLAIRNDDLEWHVSCDAEDGFQHNRLTEKGVELLTNLVALSIHEPTIQQVQCLSTLSSLQKLDLWFNNTVNDEHLGLLPSLTRLHLYQDGHINGDCFCSKKMPLLKKLVIGGHTSSLALKGLQCIASRLEVLSLWDCNVITADLLQQMTLLKKLKLVRTQTDSYNDVIRKLTGLTKLELLATVYVNDDVLSDLTQLKSLSVMNCNLITPRGISYVSKSLTHLSIQFSSTILLSDLLYCTKLQSLQYTQYASLNPSELAAKEVLLHRGIKWQEDEPLW